AELRRLAGIRIKVHGVKGDPMLPEGNHIRVDRYDIVDVGGGVTPRIGTLATISLDGTARLIFVDEEGNAEMLPRGWATKMMKNAGAKVWVVGARGKTELKPDRFGILRPGPKGGADDKQN